MFHLILLRFSLRLCIRKFYCVLEKIVVCQEISLCSGKDCCDPESIVVFFKRLLCSSKDCCVSEQKLSCVLPLWVTVLDEVFSFTGQGAFLRLKRRYM